MRVPKISLFRSSSLLRFSNFSEPSFLCFLTFSSPGVSVASPSPSLCLVLSRLLLSLFLVTLVSFFLMSSFISLLPSLFCFLVSLWPSSLLPRFLLSLRFPLLSFLLPSAYGWSPSSLFSFAALCSFVFSDFSLFLDFSLLSPFASISFAPPSFKAFSYLSSDCFLFSLTAFLLSCSSSFLRFTSFMPSSKS